MHEQNDAKPFDLEVYVRKLEAEQKAGATRQAGQLGKQQEWLDAHALRLAYERS